MAASGVQITPLPDETIEEAWSRWCEAAISSGHIRWLMFPPKATTLFPDTAKAYSNCLFESASTRHLVALIAELPTVVPYAPPTISTGTVRLAAKSTGRCRLILKLGSLYRPGEQYFPLISLILFLKGDWHLAVRITESFSSGQFSATQIYAIG
jgi:hypothetical protein